MEAYLKQENHLFYKIEAGKVTTVNTDKKWVKSAACVPLIYANKVQVITKEEWQSAKKQLDYEKIQ